MKIEVSFFSNLDNSCAFIHKMALLWFSIYDSSVNSDLLVLSPYLLWSIVVTRIMARVFQCELLGFRMPFKIGFIDSTTNCAMN